MKILVFGASGMIGSTVIRVLSENQDWDVHGTIRSDAIKNFFASRVADNLVTGVDVRSNDCLIQIFERQKPDVVINCIGITKHLAGSDDPLLSIPINAVLPYRLAELCSISGSRLIHVSTDCVFSGKKGNYSEMDTPDAVDIYGRSKALGEVQYPNTVTLRTSTIGHELTTKHGLLEWFLSNKDKCKGYSKAIFSGFPTVVFARIIRDIVIPGEDLSGLFNISAKPINKFDLLRMIARVYQKPIDIEIDEEFKIDRSLNGNKFNQETGYVPPEWDELVSIMHTYR